MKKNTNRGEGVGGMVTARIKLYITLPLPHSKSTFSQPFNPSAPKFKKHILPNFQREMNICEVVRIGSIIIFHLSKL